MAEDLTIPPPPKKREFIFFDTIEKPNTLEGKFAFTVGSSAFFGLLVGASQAWFYDYKKLPNMKFVQSLKINAKYFKRPFIFATAIGSTYAAADYLFNRYNRDSIAPIGHEKEQTLTQQFWKGAAAGSAFGVVSGKPQAFLVATVAGGAISYYTSFFQRENSIQKKLEQQRVDVLEQITNPAKYRPVENVALNENRLIYNLFYEERVDNDRIKKVSKVVYEEE